MNALTADRAEQLARADVSDLASIVGDILADHAAGPALVLDGSMYAPSWRALHGGSCVWECADGGSEDDHDAIEVYTDTLDRGTDDLDLYWEEGCLFINVPVRGDVIGPVLSAYIDAVWFTESIGDLSDLTVPAEIAELPEDTSYARLDLDVKALDVDSLLGAVEDIRSFLDDSEIAESVAFWLDALGAEQLGHDFWLTRNGHGAGFWDRFGGEQAGARHGSILSDAARPFGESYATLYLDAGELRVQLT